MLPPQQLPLHDSQIAERVNEGTFRWTGEDFDNRGELFSKLCVAVYNYSNLQQKRERVATVEPSTDF